MKEVLRYLGIGFLVGFIVVLIHSCHDKYIDNNINSPLLQPNEKEKIIVEPERHKIKIITHVSKSDDVKEAYFNDRGHTSVVINKDNSVTVNSRSWGTEFNPFIGLSYGDVFRLPVGFNFFYYRRFDLGFSVAPSLLFNKDFSVRGQVLLGYGLSGQFSNTHLFLGIDTKLEPVGGLYLRF